MSAASDEVHEDEPRAYTAMEVQEKFVEYTLDLAKYWSEVKGRTRLGALEGCVHSIHTALSGYSIGLPAFILTPDPDPTDKEYHKGEGENWYDPESKLNTDEALLDTYNRLRRKRRLEQENE